MAVVLALGSLAACVRLGWHRAWLARWRAWKATREATPNPSSSEEPAGSGPRARTSAGAGGA